MSADFRVFAHRGVSSQAPENTVAAFVKCLDYGVEWFEFDVGILSDSSLVVIHDDTVDRTTNGSGEINQMTFDQVRRLDAGAWFSNAYRFERIPELVSVIEMMNKTGLAANLEMKPCFASASFRRAFVEGVARDTEKLKDSASLLVSSFDHDLLRQFKVLRPEVVVGYLPMPGEHDLRRWVRDAEEIGCQYIHPDLRGLTESMVATIKGAGLGVNVWTVNEVAVAQELQSWGVDGVFSDCPDLLVAAGL